MSIHTPAPPVVLRRYAEDSEEINDFASVEVNDGEVDLIVSPYTDDALTYSLSPAEAWKLARELARAATLAQEAEAPA